MQRCGENGGGKRTKVPGDGIKVLFGKIGGEKYTFI